MKNINLARTASLLIAAATLGLSSALAIPQVKMGTFDAGSSGNYRANPNSEFEYILDNYATGKSTDGTWFGTFCIEWNEHFRPGRTYDVALNNGSIKGGESGAIGGKDIISVGTAFLYEQFALGTLTGFVYNNALSAAQLQNTIWELEGETSGPNDFGSFLSLAMGVANWDSNYTGTAVQVMNLTKRSGTRHYQDQLVYTGKPVPDTGSTLAMLAFGLSGFALIRRKLGRKD